MCALGNDDLGADDCEGNVVSVAEYFNEETGEKESNAVFALPADANRSKQALEWILAAKDPDSKTDENFNRLVQGQHEATAATGGLTGLRAHNATSTGYANMAGDAAIDASLENSQETEKNLRLLTEVYGKDKLAAMKPNELYKLYKMTGMLKK